MTIAIFSVATRSALGQTETTKPPAVSDTVATSAQGGVGTPFLKYSPETGIAGGIVGIYYFHLSKPNGTGELGRPSSLSAGFTVTAKNQFATGLDYDFYLSQDVLHITGGFDYKRYPFDFYGVGDHSPRDPTDNYTPLWRGGDIEVTTTLEKTEQGEGLGVGGEVEIRSDKVVASNDGGPIKIGDVPGAAGGLSSGVGLIVNYDTRDNIYSTLHGSYAAFNGMFYSRAFGSTFKFSRYTLDVRNFTSVFTTHTFAVQGLFVLANGLEPFYTMAGLGGEVNMRGYYEGRFRDNDMAVVQLEYRLPVWWRFGLVAFGDVGQVGRTTDDFTWNGFKYSFGAGLRVLLIEDQRLGVRLDYGIGNDSSELYFSILEAF
jgi:outer membrane protein assembly factor BamA